MYALNDYRTILTTQSAHSGVMNGSFYLQQQHV